MLWKGGPTGYYHEKKEISYCDSLESDRCGVLCRILFKSRLKNWFKSLQSRSAKLNYLNKFFLKEFK